MKSNLLLHSTDFIDLDDPDCILPDDAVSKAREVHMAFWLAYARGHMTNWEHITLRVWLGLPEPIPMLEQRMYVPLVLLITSRKASSTDVRYLMESCIIAEEIMRVFTVEEQTRMYNTLLTLGE